MLCKTLPSSISSNNLKEYIENNDDSISYFETKSDKEKDDIFLREASISFHETILEKSKDERFSKV
jgi:hypothetical protein